MIDELKSIERISIKDLLNSSDVWNSIKVDYHHPYVERLWTDIEDYRLSLHVIHRCEMTESLYHPHNWPSAMHILDGIYQMGIGYNKKGLHTEPSDISTLTTFENHGEMYYEMVEKDGYHYVKPSSDVCHTIMLSGIPWGTGSPKSDKPLTELSEERKEEIRKWFLDYFNHKN